jgi:hypothetical protein
VFRGYLRIALAITFYPNYVRYLGDFAVSSKEDGGRWTISETYSKPAYYTPTAVQKPHLILLRDETPGYLEYG